MASSSPSDGLLVQLGNQKKLFLSNEILQQEATAPLAILESVLERGVSTPNWRRRVDLEDIELFECFGGGAGNSGPPSSGAGWGDINEYSVLAKFELKCHLMELHNALAADESPVHEAMMRALHGKRFRQGSVLHSFDSEERSSESAVTVSTVTVKTASFTSGSLSKELDFNYIDYRKRMPEKKSVVHVVKSLPKEFHDRLAKNSVLGGSKEIVACTHAEQTAANKTKIVFFATCTADDEDGGSSSKKRGSSISAMDRSMQFLIKLALSYKQLDAIVQRRRLGYQSYIYSLNKVIARGVKSCKVCAKSFGVLRLEHFCQICGYRTCHSCSDTLDVEAVPGLIRSNRVCQTCLDSVNHCVFDDDDLDLLGSSAITDFAVTTGPSFVQLQAEMASTNRRIVTHKKWRTSQPDDELLKLIEYLFSSEPSKQTLAFERFGVSGKDSHSLRLLEGMLRHYLSRPTRLSVAECVYAEADNSRDYMLNFEEGLRIADAPPAPHEHLRLDLISRLGLLQTTRFDSEPFNVICEIAARVMECRTAFFSVVGSDLQHAVAHFNLALLKLPRRETLCAYALTGDRKPFIIRNTLHDVRFRDFFCVARGGFQFYASFPVEAPVSVGGGGVVAALVVVDKEPKRAITNRQYARMVVLTRVLTELLGAQPAP